MDNFSWAVIGFFAFPVSLFLFICLFFLVERLIILGNAIADFLSMYSSEHGSAR